jgi:sugar phosphate isomerase/epimerase
MSQSPRNHKKKLKLIKTLWGIDEAVSPSLFQSIRDEGYHGVEVIRLAWMNQSEETTLVSSLNQSGLAVVCQIHTSGGFLRDNEYIYCDAHDVSHHKNDFRTQLHECVELLSKVTAGGFINVHAGVDAWSLEEAMDFLSFALQEVATVGDGVTVTFETHRQRLFGSPFQTRDIFAHAKEKQQLLNLKLNADLSHWYCACERVFDSNQKRDATWWPALLALVAERCHYIHARFGWSQGPQMADPSAPECEPERSLQKQIWNTLLKTRIAAQSNSAEEYFIFVSPEYGPAPYLAVVPRTQEPVASLSAAVAYTKQQVEELFDQI